MTQDPGTVHTIEFFTYDDAGDLAATDATPTVTVTGPTGTTDVVPTSPSTGRYVGEFTNPDSPGRYWWTAAAEVASEPVARSGHWTVRDVDAEEGGTGFAHGLATFPSL